MQQTLRARNKVKIHFLVRKKVNYGFAIYVAGSEDELGQWQIAQSLRLNWNNDDYWSGFTEISVRHEKRVLFKYLIASYDAPMSNLIQWQQGEYNRQIVVKGDQQHIVLQNVWGANKICLNLLVPKIIIKPETQIYLAGGCNELGNWKNRIKLNRIQFQTLNQQQITKAKQNIIIENYFVYSVSFSVDRNLKNFNYFFIQKSNNQWHPDRVPNRQFKAYPGQNDHFNCLYVSNKAGNYDLLELSRFVEIHYSKIYDNIFVGGSIQTLEDVKQLKKRSINAIVYLQSLGQSLGKTAPKNLIKLISEENKIAYHSFTISLAKPQSLIEEVRQALRELAHLIQVQQKIVYINCSTGTLLSPLLIALYLSLYENMSLKRALQFVKEKHPISSIDEGIIAMASNIAGEQYFSRQIITQTRPPKESIHINFD